MIATTYSRFSYADLVWIAFVISLAVLNLNLRTSWPVSGSGPLWPLGWSLQFGTTSWDVFQVLVLVTPNVDSTIFSFLQFDCARFEGRQSFILSRPIFYNHGPRAPKWLQFEIRECPLQNHCLELSFEVSLAKSSFTARIWECPLQHLNHRAQLELEDVPFEIIVQSSI
jgi:hypothetical protein